MKRITLIILLFIYAGGMSAQQKNMMTPNDYARHWEEVAALEKKSLPQSAAEKVNRILLLAVSEQNSPQMIKALIHLGKYDLAIDAENDTLVFNRLQGMLEKSSDVAERAVLHSMLGELYLQYYQRDQWRIRQRTELRGYIPADMKEWTRNIFYDRATEHLVASMADREQLEAVAVASYAAVVEEGNDSRRFYPTLYDFLARRAIEQYGRMEGDEDLSRTLAKKQIAPESLFAPAETYVRLSFDPQPGEYNLMLYESYRKLLASLLERGMSRSVLLAELDKLESLTRLQPAYGTCALPSLEKMLEKWEGDPFSVEIIDRIADLRENDIQITAESDAGGKAEKTKALYTLLQRAIEKHSSYERIAMLENRLLRLTQPEFMVSGSSTFPLTGEKEIKVTFKNLRSLTARLYRIDSPVDVQMSLSGVRQHRVKKKTFVGEFAVVLPERAPYLQGDTVLSLLLQEPGTYQLTFASSPQTVDNSQPDYFFAVSDLALFTRSLENDLFQFFVVDRVTGAPVPRATVAIYALPGNWRHSVLTRLETLTTDDEGMAVCRKQIPHNELFYHAVKGADNGSLLSRLYPSQRSSSDLKPAARERTHLFTDRSLYRPGQTVYFKAVMIQEEENGRSVVSDHSVAFTCYDANGQEIIRQTRETNEFGSAAGEMVLPQGLLPGIYSIRSATGSVSFRVEEYKRPTFEVTFDPVKGSYRFGEEVSLKGKTVAYSGVPLQGSTITYRITRQQAWWRFWGGVPEQFAEGVVTGDDQGGFEIRFTPEKPDRDLGVRSAYSFVVEATITDLNGETQRGSYRLTVGDVSMMLQLEMADRWEKEGADPVLITAKNLNGSDVKAEGSYIIYKVEEHDPIGRPVAKGSFTTGEQAALKQKLAALKSGKYRVKLSSEDDRGNPVEAEKDLILYSFTDKRPPVKTNDWFVIRSNTFSPGKPAEVLLGTTDRVHVLYELWKEKQLLERRWLTLEKENRRFLFPDQEEQGEGIVLTLTFVKDEQMYTHEVLLHREEEDVQLKVKLDIFRDRIRPGSDEEWRVTVSDAAGNPAAAELLASMYDFSLDQIYPSQSWTLPQASWSRDHSEAGLSRDQSFSTVYGSGYIPVPWKEEPSFRFDRFNWYGFSFYHHHIMTRGTSIKAREESAVVGYGVAQNQMAVKESAVVDDAAQELLLAGENKDGAVSPAPVAPEKLSALQLRRNFSETAFFYPQLRTNEKGETQIAFTVPESNTRWRFRVLAHDRQLRSGTAEAFTVSQKELMVTPHMPRFLREGDRATLATKISNLSDSIVSGEVRLEFFDPLTEELFSAIPLAAGTKPFTLAVGASSDAAWSFDVPSGIDLLGIRVVAQSALFSDGEQHALAVLPKRMMVTESMRMDLNGNETRSFTMEQLLHSSSETAEEYRLTLEFASNPAWYAVQALPVLSDPASDNAVAWFAACYAAALGTHIGKTYPRVIAMVEAWKNEGGSREMFLSGLEKNRELKELLLEETPWVLEARNESEQLQRLSLLFDLNRSRDQIGRAVRRLQELQTPEGGWCWFKGFRPGVAITHYILYGFSRLQQLGALQPDGEILPMQSKALSFIDAEALRRFDVRKRNNKEWRNIKSISLTDLEFLYIRSAYDNYPMDEEVKEMVAFYRSVVEQHWTAYGLYERSLIAILMQREGKTGVVQAILRSFREHATRSAELGMYWANNRAQVFMSQSAVSVHTFIMDAFRQGGAATEETDQMKRWLLKQKQTQLWETTHATADAVYALLSSGSDWFAATGETTVTVGDRVVDPVQREAGTGYFKESWSRAGIRPEMGKVTVVHNGSGPAWGALYRQYFEEMDKVVATTGSLTIEKQLFVEQTGAPGKVLVPLTAEHPLQVGDKVVVRLTLRSDRDLEFVQLKDMRAACFEPTTQLSGMAWQNGLPYYQAVKDASVSFYFDLLPRGTRVFEYALYVARAGSYSGGNASVQCLYAPAFNSHTGGIRIIVKE